MKKGESFDKLYKLIGKDINVCRYRDQKLEDSGVPIPCGLHALDYGILQIGGLPRGRLVEIFGMESSGKSTLAKKFIRGAQSQGLPCLLIDAERSDRGETGRAWLKKCGVDVDDPDFSYLAESNLDKVAKAAINAIRECGVKLLVIDSIAALYVATQLEDHASGKKKPSDADIAIEARVLTKVARELNALADDYNATVILINQARKTIGRYGEQWTTPGGSAIKFYSSIRLQLTRKEKIEENKEIVGALCKTHSFKNKCAKPWLTTFITIRWDGHEVDDIDWFCDMAIRNGYIKQESRTYTYVADSSTGEIASVVGINNLKSLYRDDPKLNSQIKKWIEENKGLLITEEEVNEDSDDCSIEKDINLAALSLEE